MIIAVHDVTAFGNTEFGKYTKFGKIPIFVYIYQILIISDPDETVFYYLLSSFSVKKNYVHIYHTSYHRILRHKISIVHKVPRCPTTILKSTSLKLLRFDIGLQSTNQNNG